MCSPIEWLRLQNHTFAELGADEQDAIMHFSLVWTYFEANVCQRDANPNLLVDKAQAWHDRHLLDERMLVPFLTHFKGRYVDEHGELNARFYTLGLRGCCRSLVERVLQGQLTTPRDIAAGLLLIVYRLRNRLFHGEKWLDGGLEDQLGNFTNSIEILKLAVRLNREG
jgi:hypothetical protein